MAQSCFSDLECKIICEQIERRAKYRKEFLIKRTDPCKHATEAGYVVSICILFMSTLFKFKSISE